MDKSDGCLKAGIDVGSTTAKVVILDKDNSLVFSEYKRHNAKINDTLVEIFENAKKTVGSNKIAVSITGSAGMGIAESHDIPFEQEVVASADAVKTFFPDVKALIDIGGEDSKIIFFDENKRADMRMNGNCAGGTGAFIDQMSALIDVPVEELSALAEKHKKTYPIASRCGVFAKTDLQNLLSREIKKEDIAASVFNAVVVQILNTLARGFEIRPKVLFCGGPLAFIPMLREAFKKRLKLKDEDIVLPDKPELLAAIGTAVSEEKETGNIDYFISKISKKKARHTFKDREKPLFENKQGFEEWESHRFKKITRLALDGYKNKDNKDNKANIKSDNKIDCFIGIDSGSTTTKIAVIDIEGNLIFDYYITNKGNHIASVKKGLTEISERFREKGIKPIVKKTVVTGYGEELIKTVFEIDIGIVETIAHLTAAKKFDPEVSFVLDIGGQDMKAMYVRKGHIMNIEINEACSSGCGSFIQTFAKTLGYSVSDFAKAACTAKKPCNLGTRCTVFMNSKVKQFLREGATIPDIAAGLSYSVIKNCLNKVLKIRDFDVLGNNIVVQGGTFQNQAIQRAFELMIGKKVSCPEISGLMGAYGCALVAAKEYKKDLESGKAPENTTVFPGLENITGDRNSKREFLQCSGCENNCTITKITFENGKVFFTGNKCEKIFTNKGESKRKGFNFYEYKRKLLFRRDNLPEKPVMTMGVPRALNMYENFPFWNTLLTECGIKVELSSRSNLKLYEKGAGTVMSDNICFPAKLVHGHIIDLIEKKVDRIFYPIIVFEKHHSKANNSFNCPIVSGYPDVIESAVNPSRHDIPIDKPTISFRDETLLTKSCIKYLSGFGIKKETIKKAVRKAIEKQKSFKEKIRKKADEIIRTAEEENRKVMMLIGRPYHLDPLVNHKIPEIISHLGMDAITDDSTRILDDLGDTKVLTQWAYSNRLYNAANFALEHDCIEVVQLNSFACGPDVIAIDEVNDILRTANKNATVLRIDEVASPGSVNLRLRTLIESIRLKNKDLQKEDNHDKKTKETKISKRKDLPEFTTNDRNRTILLPYFSKFHSPLIKTIFKAAGYDAIVLPETDEESLKWGLKYTNNEICYPAILVIGDIIKALKSGKYDPKKVAVGITQTGGQCRASNYLALIKKALIFAGYDNIPIISVNAGKNSLHKQSGFSFKKADLIKYSSKAFFSVIFADALSQLYYSTAVREKNKGDASKLTNKYLEKSKDIFIKGKKYMKELLRKAVKEFNSIPVYDRRYPQIGVVGEIYVKYSDFGNHNILEWLTDNGIEVVVPPLIEFFTKMFTNNEANIKANVKRDNPLRHFGFLAEKWINNAFEETNNILDEFKFARKFHDVRILSKKAEKAINLVNQYGEGWLITGEMMDFAEKGIDNVLCLQPFGCISNQIIAKGVEKRLKDIYPNLNILFIDLDSDTCQANYFNRMHFLIKSARDSVSANNH